MPLDISQLSTWIIIATVFIAGFTQAAIGFGSGLIIIPCLMVLGYTLPQTLFIMCIPVSAQLLWKCWHHRKELPWRLSSKSIVIRIFGAIPGYIALGWLASHNGKGQAQQIIGIIVLLAIATQLFVRVTPRKQVHPSWLWLASSCSGFLGASVGIGGPPLVLYVLAHNWKATTSKCFLWLNFLSGIPIHVTVLCFMYPSDAPSSLLTGLSLTPVMFSGTFSGLISSRYISIKTLRICMYTLLIWIGISATVGGPRNILEWLF